MSSFLPLFAILASALLGLWSTCSGQRHDWELSLFSKNNCLLRRPPTDHLDSVPVALPQEVGWRWGILDSRALISSSATCLGQLSLWLSWNPWSKFSSFHVYPEYFLSLGGYRYSRVFGMVLCPGTKVLSGKTRRGEGLVEREDSGNSPVMTILIIPCQCMGL